MNDRQDFHKVSDGSNDRDYDVFEEFPDGSTAWRASIFGIQNAELKLRELAEGSKNNFFALDLHDWDRVAICPHSIAKKSMEEKRTTA